MSNFFSKNLVAFPGYALLSCINVGIPNLCAAVIAPPQIYPPVPITISGLNSLTIFFASPNPFKVFKLFDKVLKEIFLLIPYASTVLSSYPALGTKSFSIPLLVPMNIISESFSFSFILFAIAIPGFMWPPVPAAAIITFILTPYYLLLIYLTEFPLQLDLS